MTLDQNGGMVGKTSWKMLKNAKKEKRKRER